MATRSISIPSSSAEIRERARRQSRAFADWDEKHLRDLGFEVNGADLAFQLHDDPHFYRAQRRALSAQLEVAGAYAVPSTFEAALEIALLYASPIRDYARVIRAEGNPYRFPTVDDTGVNGYELAENTQPSPNPADITTFGGIALYARKWTLGIVLCPFELIEDGGQEVLAGWLGDLLGRRIGRGQNAKFTSTVLAEATLGVTSASPSAITADELLNLFYSIDPAYREMPGFAWQMNNTTLKTVRSLKDSVGRYLFKTRRKPGEPDLLLGVPVAVNRDMADIAASNITVACGAWTKVVIRDIPGARLQKMDELYADSDQLGFASYLRSSAALADAGTHPIKYLQQHS